MTMTHQSEMFMRDDPQVLTGRLARFVHRVPCKELARIMGSTERVAENVRRGHWPTARHFYALVRTFGRDLTEAVFYPDAAAERLEQEVQALEAQLADRRAALRDVAGSAPRPAQARARHEDGAAAPVVRP